MFLASGLFGSMNPKSGSSIFATIKSSPLIMMALLTCFLKPILLVYSFVCGSIVPTVTFPRLFSNAIIGMHCCYASPLSASIAASSWLPSCTFTRTIVAWFTTSSRRYCISRRSP